MLILKIPTRTQLWQTGTPSKAVKMAPTLILPTFWYEVESHEKESRQAERSNIRPVQSCFAGLQGHSGLLPTLLSCLSKALFG